MLVGQWLVVGIDTITGLNFSIRFLDISYSFIFSSAKNIIIAINLVPIFIIMFLLKLENMLELEKENRLPLNDSSQSLNIENQE